MALWQFDFYVIPNDKKVEDLNNNEFYLWKNHKIDISTEEFFNGTLEKKKSWSKKIEQYGDNDGTCIQIFERDNNSFEIRCRLDLRTLTLEELEKILEYIFLISGNVFYEEKIFPPQLSIVKELLKKSNALKFCVNPKQYFENLSNKN